MQTEEEKLKHRFLELAQKAADHSVYTFTEFLTPAEQAILQSLARHLPVPFALHGGAEGCERQLACFGSETSAGREAQIPICCILAQPASARFADALTHRDYLGALMNLGVTRSVLGDIVLRDSCAYLFCFSRIAPYIVENLTQVKHTAVRCSLAEELPSGPLYSLQESLVQVLAARVDTVIARAYNLSREESAALFPAGRVFLNTAACTNSSRILQEGDVVSVRGFGRFRCLGEAGTSRKGKLNLRIGKYGE